MKNVFNNINSCPDAGGNPEKIISFRFFYFRFKYVCKSSFSIL
ncbi:hypothetical protein [Methanobrevibacter arboriphilus]|nr:hypothetical protein [Methanobrevibacter arboriphilus]